MRFCIPLLGDRVAPRCTVADGVLIGVNRRGRITHRQEIRKPVRGSLELLAVLNEHRVEVLVCGGVLAETRETLASEEIELIPNIAGRVEDVLQAIAEGEITTGMESGLLPACPHCVSGGGRARRAADGSLEPEAPREQPSLGRPGAGDEQRSTRRRRIERMMLEVARDLQFEDERRLCRLSELVYFCLEMGYRSVGVAYCVDLAGPAEILIQVLRRFFSVHPAPCRRDTELNGDEANTHCNPADQAEMLNELETDLNVIVGLCMGSDCVFTQRSAAPVTTLFVKDRALANNPIGAVYSDRYLKEATQPAFESASDGT